MTRKLPILPFFITITFISCSNTVEKPIPIFSDLNKDFPTFRLLEFKAFKKYNIFESGTCSINGSILWHFVDSNDDLGTCYDLNTGKKLSTIATRGKAAYELIDLETYNIVGDSVQLHAGQNTIKTFAKKDILENIPMGKRRFSVVTAPDSIHVCRMIKLPNGSVLATMQTTLYSFEHQKFNINKNSVAVFSNNSVKAYNTIDYGSFNMPKAVGEETAKNELLKCCYAEGSVQIKDNNMAVFSMQCQFILYTFDINSGKVVKEKRYTKPLRDGTEMSLSTINDMRLNISKIKANNKYIVCIVEGHFSKKDKESKLYKSAIFVFDWNLKPIKRFNLPDIKNVNYFISDDCKSAYYTKDAEDGMILYKADLSF